MLEVPANTLEARARILPNRSCKDGEEARKPGKQDDETDSDEGAHSATSSS